METSKKFRPDPKLPLMDQVRQVLRYHHYAYRTEQTYCDWIMRYIRYHGGKTHPRNMGMMLKEFYAVSQWDWDTGKPKKEKLVQLGLESVANDLYA